MGILLSFSSSTHHNEESLNWSLETFMIDDSKEGKIYSTKVNYSWKRFTTSLRWGCFCLEFIQLHSLWFLLGSLLTEGVKELFWRGAYLQHALLSIVMFWVSQNTLYEFPYLFTCPLKYFGERALRICSIYPVLTISTSVIQIQGNILIFKVWKNLWSLSYVYFYCTLRSGIGVLLSTTEWAKTETGPFL